LYIRSMNKLYLIGLLLLPFVFFGQLKVTQSGWVGIGTNNPISTLHVNGRIYLTGNGNTFRILPNNPGTEIGTTTDYIDFWSSYVKHHVVAAQKFNRVSDSSLKTEITPLNMGLDKVLKLKTYNYKIKEGKKGQEIYKNEFGFISQEIKEIFPDMTTPSMGVLTMDYDQIIPITVKAIQEQQLIIEELKGELEELKKELTPNSILGDGYNHKGFILYQNAPNPFKENTVIKYEIKTLEYSSALIVIFDMNGLLLNSYDLDSSKDSIIIKGNEYKPGMYIYSLIVDNTEIATKKMILLD